MRFTVTYTRTTVDNITETVEASNRAEAERMARDAIMNSDKFAHRPKGSDIASYNFTLEEAKK